MARAWPSCRTSGSPYFTSLPDLYDAKLEELQKSLEDSVFTSVDFVKAYLARIHEVNLNGPGLHAIIETNPFAVDQANALDVDRRIRGSKGRLHGIPIVVKDSIATRYEDFGLNTTAGSYALLGSIVPRNAFVVDRLQAAGAIILGKANMSEWADYRGNVFCWSARGGLATSPFYPGGDAEGSSSGSAIATAIGLAGAALSTETDGSTIAPACRQNIVGIKPTLGLTSRAGVIPVSEHQDSTGIFARSVADAAMILAAIAGKDARDPYTLKQPDCVPDYFARLNATAIQGARFGVARELFQGDWYSQVTPEINSCFNDALRILESLGAIIVDPIQFPGIKDIQRRESESRVLLTDLKSGLEHYMLELVEVPSGTRTLRDLIAFNEANKDLELPVGYNDQDRFLIADSLPGLDNDYQKALAHNIWLGTEGSIDYALRTYNLDAIIVPSRGRTSTPAALAGYPMISVPLGFLPDDKEPTLNGHVFYPAPGLPFGLAFTSSAFTEEKLLNYALAFEQHTKTRLKRKAFSSAIPKTQLIDVM